VTARYLANAGSSAQDFAEWLPQLVAILLIFCANEKQTWRVNRLTMLSIADSSFDTMPDTTWANFVLFMLSTHFTVKSIMLRSRWFNDLYQTFRLSAKRFIFKRPGTTKRVLAPANLRIIAD
jgi:hypothetical protein